MYFYDQKCEKLVWNTGVKDDCVALLIKIWNLMIVIRLVSKVHDQKVSWSLAIFSSAIIMKGIIFMTIFYNWSRSEDIIFKKLWVNQKRILLVDWKCK